MIQMLLWMLLSCQGADPQVPESQEFQLTDPLQQLKCVDGRLYLLCGDPKSTRKKFSAIDIATGNAGPAIEVSGNPTHFDISHSQALFSTGNEGIQVRDLASGKVTKTIKIDRPVFQSYFLDKQICANVANVASHLQLFDIGSGERLADIELEGVTGGFVVIGWTAYFSHNYPGGLQIIDLDKRAITHSISCKEWLQSVRVVGSRAYAMGSGMVAPSGYWVFDLENHREAGVVSFPVPTDFDLERAYSIVSGGFVVTHLKSMERTASVKLAGARAIVIQGAKVCVSTDTSVHIFDATSFIKK
jgi:hypothetical protein